MQKHTVQNPIPPIISKIYTDEPKHDHSQSKPMSLDYLITVLHVYISDILDSNISWFSDVLDVGELGWYEDLGDFDKGPNHFGQSTGSIRL